MIQNHPHLPIHHRVDNGYGRRPPYYERHPTLKYYAHRVKESLTTRVSKFICTIFLFLLILFGLIAFILWLSLRPHRPRFYIEDFSIPALAQPNAPPESATINFNVSIRNSNQKVEVHYYSIGSTIIYRGQAIGSIPIVTQPFDQESKNTTLINGLVSGSSLSFGGQSWIDIQNDRRSGNVEFKLVINSVIKFEIFSWHSRRHKMHADCPAVVGPDGLLLPANKGKRCPVYFV